MKTIVKLDIVNPTSYKVISKNLIKVHNFIKSENNFVNIFFFQNIHFFFFA